MGLGKSATLGAPLAERLGCFVGGIYLIKRGIDVIADELKLGPDRDGGSSSLGSQKR